jgi:hypothetical protein
MLRYFLVNAGILGKNALYVFPQLSVNHPSENFLRTGNIKLDTTTVVLSFPFNASDIFVLL